MKVLFAVSNEEISESIVKKYQKEYKQIISYKNVYYFNAIIKELQKDKTYDRVVISEDLEAFTHTQYDQIDKFIFEKLDNISDEASNSKGADIPIILICSDRRTKSEEILVKLFGIGVYNAIIGNDRSVDEVCRLINRPRSKKEAKLYYKIESEEVNYQAENENDVSEVEIQNILAHYKRLGKNEDRYVDSFNNIAAQYNDTQLRVISKFLPLNVRAVLEERSPKYQQIMSFNNSVSNNLRYRNSKEKKEAEQGTSEKLLTPKTKEQILTKPVVIPSAVNMQGAKKLSKKVSRPEEKQVENNEIMPEVDNTPKEVKQVEKVEKPEQEVVQVTPEPVKRGRGRPRKNAVPVQESVENPPVKRKRGRPRKNPIPEEVEEIEEVAQLPLEEPEEEPKVEQVLEPVIEPVEDLNVLPGFGDVIENEEDEEETTGNHLENIFETVPNNTESNNEPEELGALPGFDDYDEEEEESSKNETEYEPINTNYNVSPITNNIPNRINQNYEPTIDLSRLLTPDKKIVSFVGTSKNGTSFIVNNVAEYLSSQGVNTAILDTTRNRNSYYIYTKNEEGLRNIATKSIENLANGVASGISVNKNLTVYTSLPDEEDTITNVDRILETLLQKHSLILIDTDFETPIGYFKESMETYLVQSLDILTIQPLTAFLRELKAKNVLDEKKLRIILNKVVRIRGISEKTIIGGMAYYNDPAMSFMTELFDRNLIKYISIPFEEEIYAKYLEGIIECEVTLKGYSKTFMQILKELASMVYQGGGQGAGSYKPPSIQNNGFSQSMNDTLDQMKRSF